MFSVGSRLSFLNLLAVLSLALTPVYSAQAESYDVEPSYFPSPEYSPEPEATPIYEEESATPEESPTYDEWPTPEETPLAEDSPEPEAEETPTYEEEPTPEETPAVEESPEPEAEETPTPAPPCGEEEGPEADTGILPAELTGGETIFEESEWTANDDSGSRTYFRSFEKTEEPPPAAPNAPGPDGEIDNTVIPSLENYPDAAVYTYGYVSLTLSYTCKPNGEWEISWADWDGGALGICPACNGTYEAAFESWRNISYVNGTADYSDGLDSSSVNRFDLRFPRDSENESGKFEEKIYAGPPSEVSILSEHYVSGPGLIDYINDQEAQVLAGDIYEFTSNLIYSDYKHSGPGLWDLERETSTTNGLNQVIVPGDRSIRDENYAFAYSDFVFNVSEAIESSISSESDAHGMLLSEITQGLRFLNAIQMESFGKTLTMHASNGQPKSVSVESSVKPEVNIGWDEFGSPLRQITAEDVTNYSAAQDIANQFDFPGSWPEIEESPGD